ncbi:hypothetical protein [Azospirillum rugosum]|uniref:DUF2135 domain-containing protein n=1 Tax=Azospirillum rugosum TaxID=416170 RepID=A0ABS4SD08_9PROT|nr:hypothetical protein [Azospirillum rugosum]MBP2290444.1 hypothetical protein [Azospirillum rugosum]MDQ0527920.1 hypothetical protein [Azospirillum rugosum]
MNDFLGEDQTGVLVARDLLTLLLCGFVACAVLAVPFINEAKKTEGNQNNSSSAAAGTEPPGNVIIEARWDDKLRTDVDLWVQAPGDVPVGYSNKSGLIFNLLRDDLGAYADPTEINFETSYSRGIPPGEYAVNVHLFRNLENAFPIWVRVVARVKTENESGAATVAATRVRLDHEGEEVTAFRFNLTEKGELVPGSLNAVSKPLRSAKN